MQRWLVSISLPGNVVFQRLLALYFGVLFTAVPILSENHTCIKQDLCSCRQHNGIIDLHQLASSKPNKPRFSKDIDVYMYYYNPCINFTLGSEKSKCRNVAACRYSSVSLEHENLGTQNSVIYGYNSTRKQLYLKYSSGVPGNITTFVYLRCDSKTNFNVEDSTKGSVFVFDLSSPCACPDGCPPQHATSDLSAGTILCIILIIMVSTYFVVGMLYKKAVHGAIGMDIIPNVTFWTSLPGLIKDGYLFFISPCLGERVEYKSYERL